MSVPEIESLQLEDRYQLPTYAKMALSIERGENCYVFDAEGQQYLDLYGGHAVVLTGHCHPRVVKAISDQAQKLIFYSNATYTSVRGRAVEKLLQLAGEPFYQVFLVNSGAEANENALKLARATTGRREIISAENAFHGRNYGALSATGIAKYRDYLDPAVPNHRILPFDKIARAVSEETAAVLIEPIQSMGGMVVIPPEILKAVESACRDSGALLLFDEIQTGLGRTGTFLYAHSLGIEPDMVSLAKGLASGYPAGGVLVNRAVAEKVSHGDLGTTFGGNPLGCAAMLATLEVLEDEKLPERARQTGALLQNELLKLDSVEEVRGAGLLIGIRFRNRSAREVQKALFEEGILTGSSYDPAVLRLMPPLTLEESHVRRFLEVLARL